MTGIFTDSDLARLFEARRYEAFDQPICGVMTARPRTVPLGSMLADALAILAELKISELPVVGPAGVPVGLLDVTGVVGMMPDRDEG
ncbi:MAG TPA: CBS domain-containing protein [Pirellulales bacterium]|nr:CBS domain-containing protein [Pirellulales bacterium]